MIIRLFTYYLTFVRNSGSGGRIPHRCATVERILIWVCIFTAKRQALPLGEYFRRNVWGWHPLADLSLDLAPSLCKRCSYWHSNDRDGLHGSEALALGCKFEEVIADGSVASYVAIRDADRKAGPRGIFELCGGEQAYRMIRWALIRSFTRSYSSARLFALA